MSDQRSTTRLGLLFDLGLLSAVPIALFVVYYLLPPAVQSEYVLRTGAPTPVTLVSAAYVHGSEAHLFGNLIGYGLGAITAHYLCVLLGEHRWFRLTFVTFLFGLPVLVSGVSIVSLGARFDAGGASTSGFSGVAAGFAGFAAAAFLAYVRRRTDRTTTWYAGIALGLVLAAEVTLTYTRAFPETAIGAIALGVALCLVGIGNRLRTRNREIGESWRSTLRGLLLVGWTVGVLVVLVAGLFPARVVDGLRFTNVYAHAAGFVLGVVVSAWGYRYWSVNARWTA